MDKNIDENSNFDDFLILEEFIAGPSGLNTNYSNELKSNFGHNLTQGLDQSLVEIGVQEKKNNESIGVIEENSQNRTGTDVQIIGAKLNKSHELDSDIQVLFEIITPQEVMDMFRNSLKSVQDLTQLSLTTTRILMKEYFWNESHFIHDFLELGIEEILKALELEISYELKKNTKRHKRRYKSYRNQRSEEEMKTCLVCFDALNNSEMFGTNCGHFLCIDCWNQFITTHVNDSSSDEKIGCPGDKCTNIIDDDDLMGIIQEQTLKDKYLRLITNSYVTNNPLLRWCPNESCLHAVRVKENGFQDIECICKTVFCFLCGDQWHEPLSCEHYKNWIQKYSTETMYKISAKCLTSHAMCCPKCQFPIEKNGGCHHILCTKCKFDFCYKCLGSVRTCLCIVDEDKAQALKAQTIDKQYKNDLEIYPFYRDSYKNQLKQLETERRLQESITQKLERSVKSPEFKSGLKFLKSAFTVLCHCRQTLMYSYVFGYYLVEPLFMIEIYDILLKQLEKQTHILSELLTKESILIQKEAVIQSKSIIQPIYKKCKASRIALVLHIRTGLNDNIWQFSHSLN